MLRIFARLLVIAITLSVTSAAPTLSGEPLAWPEITRGCRPGAYWWWMGSAVNPADLTRELKRYRAAGMGGVHIVPIYGAKGYENQYIDYLSPQWMAMLRHTVKEAESLDMSVDMTVGTGWCFGGPNVLPGDGCAQLDLKTFAAPPGIPWKLPVDARNLQALVACSAEGEIVDLKKKHDQTKATEWTPEGGAWQVYAIAQKPTNRRVKRAAPGGAGYMVNPFHGETMRRYLERFTRAFADYEGPKPHAMYHDSYEYDST